MNPQVWSFRAINESTFIKRFGPTPNHLDTNASFDFGAGGCLFETYGDELAYVCTQDKRTIWTIIEGDEALAIVSGLHFVNRLGCIVTGNPVEDRTVCTILLE